MKKLYLAVIAAALVIVSGCNKEEVLPQESEGRTLYATVDPETKVGFDQKGQFFWSNNDEIAIAGQQAPAVGKMKIESGQGTGNAVFKDFSGDKLGKYAIYPYDSKHKLDGDALTFYLSTWQNGTIGTDFWDGDPASRPSTKAPMWGEINNGQVKFKHLGGVFCIRLTDMPSGKFAVVLNADQRLGGDFTVTLSDQEPVIKADNTSTGKITYNVVNDKNLKNGIVYIQAPTGTFTNLKITVNNVLKKTYEKVTVNRCDLVVLSDKEQAKGADFSKAKVHTVPAPANAGDRWGAFDGKYVTVIGPSSYYISLADIISGETTLKNIDVSGITGNWPHVTTAQMANGHMYFVPLSNKSGVIKLFYKETPSSKPEEIYSGTCNKLRYADGMSLDLDENGNGYLFLQGSSNNETKDVVRLHISNFKTVDELVTLPNELENPWTYDTVTKIEESGEYIHSGRDCNPCLIDKNYKQTFDFRNEKNDAVSEMSHFASIRIINFNGERYMFGVQASNGQTKVTPHAYVYDVSTGETVKDGILGFLNSWPKTNLYNLEISAAVGTYVVADYYVEKDAAGKDSKLYLYAASEKNGFKIIEVPAK